MIVVCNLLSTIARSLAQVRANSRNITENYIYRDRDLCRRRPRERDLDRGGGARAGSAPQPPSAGLASGEPQPAAAGAGEPHPPGLAAGAPHPLPLCACTGRSRERERDRRRRDPRDFRRDRDRLLRLLDPRLCRPRDRDRDCGRETTGCDSGAVAGAGPSDRLRNAEMAFHSVMFGTSCLCARGSFVRGDVSCRCSQATIASCSYECPSAHTYGSAMSSCVIGHMQSSGHDASPTAGTLSGSGDCSGAASGGGAAAAGAAASFGATTVAAGVASAFGGASGNGLGAASGNSCGGTTGGAATGGAAAGVGAAATALSGSIVRLRHV